MSSFLLLIVSLSLFASCCVLWNMSSAVLIYWSCTSRVVEAFAKNVRATSTKRCMNVGFTMGDRSMAPLAVSMTCMIIFSNNLALLSYSF